MKRQSSPEQLEKSLTERLFRYAMQFSRNETFYSLTQMFLSFHLNESSSLSCSESSCPDNEDDLGSCCNTFAGVRVLSPIANNCQTPMLTAPKCQHQVVVSENDREMMRQVTIRSKTGTVRGVKNRVRQGIATFLRDPTKKVKKERKKMSVTHLKQKK